MNKILIFGNVIKDVYLDLVGGKDDFETDDDGVEWMNLAFASSKHYFSDRNAIYGGAKITEEVLEKFGFLAEIASYKKAEEYRYILCREQKIGYFVGEKKHETEFVQPSEDTKLIIIDRSAGVTEDFVKKIEKYHEENPKVLIIAHVGKKKDDISRQLVSVANLVFIEGEGADNPTERFCVISRDGIQLGKNKVEWKLQKEDMQTHLTIFSIAMATVIAMLISGNSIKKALEYARVNVENAKMNEALDPRKIEEILEDEKHNAIDLRSMAKLLMAPKKGILAADESGGSIHKEFDTMNIPDDERHRRDYRNIFFTTPDLEKYVNGVILFDETARQKADDGRDFVNFLISRGVIPGIKVDMGLKNFPNSEEKYTTGLEGLRNRLATYYDMGLRFAKWRAAFEISSNTPSDFAIKENCRILAEYAKACQKEKIVPIVEPEVVYDGDYTISKCKEVTKKVLTELIDTLKKEEVELPATILKINMVLAGKQFPVQSTAAEVGKATAEVLRGIPRDIAGVVFLSGGQTPEQATEALKEVMKNGPFDFPVTFSFARALQQPALEAWKGDNKNKEKASEAFLKRLVANCEALE